MHLTNVIQKQIKLKIEGEEEDLENAREVERIYNEGKQIMENALLMQDAGKPDEAISLFKNDIEPLFNDVLLPKIDNSIDESKEEIAEAHHKLVNVIYSSVARGIAPLALFTLFICVITLSVMKRIILSINKLRKGAEIIRDGNLRYRVELNTKDEFQYLASSFNDMAEALNNSKEKIISMSITDELTGLLNRRGFMSLAQQQMKISRRSRRKMILFFADLDGLKKINDTLGHHEGDLTLVGVSDILRKTFRESDLIARMGGDEFAVLMIDVSEPNAGSIITSRLQEKIKAYNVKEGRPYKLSMSFGMVCCDPRDSSTIDELLTQADKLMYEMKNKKRNLAYNCRS